MSEGAVGVIEQKPVEIEKPKERMSDEQMGALISAIGNHEGKAITLLAMRNGNLYNMRDLNTAFSDLQGDDKGWETGYGLPFDYCGHSLSPIGLVTKETLNSDLSTYGYQITEYGKDFGVPLSGLLLDFSERHNLSLSKLFASTGSKSLAVKTDGKEEQGFESKNRAPINTLKILMEIHTAPDLPIGVSELERRIGLEGTSIVSRHLFRLAESGFINFIKREYGAGVSITEDQRAILTELLEIIYKFQDQDPEVLDEGKRLAEELSIDPEKVSSLMRRAKENSGRASHSPVEETQQLIISILSANPGVGNIEIRQILKDKYDKQLSNHMVGKLTHILVKRELIGLETEGRTRKFVLKSAESSPDNI